MVARAIAIPATCGPTCARLCARSGQSAVHAAEAEHAELSGGAGGCDRPIVPGCRSWDLAAKHSRGSTKTL